MIQLKPYLSGESFDADLSFRPEIISHALPRGALLEHWAKSRRVLHVGFADHVPLIASRIADGSWLHARLTRSAAACHGIDISAEAVETARAQGFRNVQVLDVFADEAAQVLTDFNPEMVLVPDVIEHLPAPAEFLRRLVQCLPKAEFVVSVPNAFALRNAIHAAGGVEHINTDHRVWYSPFTLLKVMDDAGLTTRSLHGCQVAPPGSLKGRLLSALVGRQTIWSDVLLARATRAV